MACVLREGNFFWEAAVAVAIAGGQCCQMAKGEIADGCGCLQLVVREERGKGRLN